MIKMIGCIMLLLIVQVVTLNAVAATMNIKSSSGENIAVSDEDQKKIYDAVNEQKSQEKVFGGFNVGAGVMVGFDLGNKQRVQKASVVNGVVRIDQASSSNIGVIAEVHKLYQYDSKGGQWGYGPYVGLVLSGENNIINAASAGVMFGFLPKGDKQSLNIGVGAMVTPNAQVLGDGIEANQPLPAGETGVRYKNTTIYGVAVAISFGF